MKCFEGSVESVLDVKAKVAIPMHFGAHEGNKENIEKFVTLLKDKVTVVIKAVK